MLFWVARVVLRVHHNHFMGASILQLLRHAHQRFNCGERLKVGGLCIPSYNSSSKTEGQRLLG
jgi:hypothetical protein